MEGLIKSCSDRYGFIRARGRDYFFKRSAWKEDDDPVVGEKVTFIPVRNDKGDRAIRVYRAKENEE